jgi:uncharacterized sulfatase
VVYWKGKIAGGRPYSHPVISLDVAATALAAAGLPDEPELDGVNLLPYLRGEKQGAPHETLYWRWIAQSAVREGKWKYLRGGAREYLFDLDRDREEKCNVLEEHPDVARRLKARLAKWSGELSPPGLETKQMARVWEQYFDYYLEGKPIPKPPARPGRAARAGRNRVQGWIARNSTVEVNGGVLRVRSAGKGQRPFIATAGLDLPADFTAVLQLRTEKGGTAGVAWREAGQKTFPPEQVATFDCRQAAAWQEQRVAISGDGRVIHVRLLLPPGGADIESIQFQEVTGRVLKEWRFDR